ncbi:MAG: TIGR03085 family protein [Micromonosporaceae bacterium]|nr:TIGR03085 family protein [Micromonosporaceae bacterium]
MRYARAERLALAETLEAVGPGAPTLCAGWASQDLAAHLVVRERRPLASLGNVIRPLSGYTDRVQRRLAEASVGIGEYRRLVEAVRQGPPGGLFRIGGVDESLNLAEFFVHHEDLRRAQPGWAPRELPRGYTEALWQRARMIARIRPPEAELRGLLVAPGYGEYRIARARPGLTVAGAPPELLLWLFGRRSVAEVTLDETR